MQSFWKQSRKKTVEDGEAHSEFVGEWQQKRQAARAKTAGQQPPKKRKGSSKGTGQPPPQRLPATFDMVDQHVVKSFMPESSCIWKSRGAGAWITKVQGFDECSKRVVNYGESEALRMVIANAWRDWCTDAGIPFSECPMQGLPALGDE